MERHLGDLVRVGTEHVIADGLVEHRVLAGGLGRGGELDHELQVGRDSQFFLQFPRGRRGVVFSRVQVSRRGRCVLQRGLILVLRPQLQQQFAARVEDKDMHRPMPQSAGVHDRARQRVDDTVLLVADVEQFFAARGGRRGAERRLRCGHLGRRRLSRGGTANHRSPQPALQHKIPPGIHPHRRVGGVSPGVLFFDVEPQADHARVGQRLGFQLGMQRAKDSPATEVGMHIHALQPPDVAIPPVGPFVGVHQLPDHPAIQLGQQVPSALGIGEQGLHPGNQVLAIELLALRFESQLAVVIDNHFPVGGSRRADLQSVQESTREKRGGTNRGAAWPRRLPGEEGSAQSPTARPA